MKITAIEKKKRLYLLELDGSDKLYVTEDTIVRFMLSKDKVITPEELSEIKDFAQFSYGKNLALYQLSFKQRTTREVRDYLAKHEIEEKTMERVIKNLQADGWLDDAKFAASLIEQNLLSGDKGGYVLKQKLLQKGIAASIIDEALAEADFSEVCQRVAEKLLRKYEGKFPTKGLKDKLIQNLTSKGFSYSEANQAVQGLELEKDQESELDLIYRELDKQYPKYSRKYEGYELKQRLTQALARKGFDFSDIASALREYL
ncbi:recombination regulator RecX [Streptococcus moroccensis]|uniref:Regulatory protein RecX n=1 Tax=Streptococcus moroccensis TaxID=1451356 RepID=A0ABT9YP74_9STRE|nr:recombination regulator RecX [Streptococcus moroccensis]MDQ0221539.1 regulatory protein [Streptococcus moroccensis]